MKNILKLMFFTSIILISCKLQNITGTGIDNRFVGTWTGTINENDEYYTTAPIPQQLQQANTEETNQGKTITVIINEDGSILIDADSIPASNIYKDIINNIHYYTISYIISYEENAATIFNYMIIFEDNTKAAIEGTTITTLNEKEKRTKIPQTTINKQTETN